MKKRKPHIEIYSFGEYTQWDRESKNIPKILNITNEIKAVPGAEFGYVLRIKKGKGEKLIYKIEHPPFKDKNGKILPAFTGEHYIKSNDYQFFLGDCIWEPVDDKLGKWELT
ncbi:MAG: DUF3859 domain-containing protein, partial [Mariniphaga sp.]|nr:DUF3859 domain-containing protein [Mariniphaga sp.]